MRKTKPHSIAGSGESLRIADFQEKEMTGPIC